MRVFRSRGLVIPFALALFLVGGVAELKTVSANNTDVLAPCASQFWERDIAAFDAAVANEVEERSWFFGPANTDLLAEPYSADDYTHRQVQYWEKGRKECTPIAPDIGLDSTFTLGLLAYELVTGQIQISHEQFIGHAPANIHVAGDPGFEDAVTYESFNHVVDSEARAVGEVISETIDHEGNVSYNPHYADYGVTTAYYIAETEHAIASEFWTFMTGQYLRFDDRLQQFNTQDFYPESLRLIGLPITEAYWTTVPVAGEHKDVLVQCFERRCLTYTPDNPDGWQVEMGNIGMHYYQWRYPDGHES